MTQYLTQNLALLNRWFPQVAQTLEKVHSEECQPVFIDTDGMYDLHWNGHLIYEAQPAKALEQTMAMGLSSYPKMVFCYGVGSGEYLQKIFRSLNTCTEHVLIIEKVPEFFRCSLEIFDWSPILEDGRVQLAIGLPESNLELFFLSYLEQLERFISIHTVNNLFDQASLRLFGPYYQAVAETLKKVGNQRAGLANVSPEDTYRGFINIAQNMPICGNEPLFDPLEGLFRGFPGISVAAGPSLKRSIPWLKEIKDRAVVISTDASLKTLLENGIVPHMVTCLERVPEARHFFQDLPRLDHTWLLANPVIWPETFALYPGPKINMIRSVGQLAYFFPQAKIYDTGNSSAHMNYVALERMGCDPIMLVGQDLAYDRHSQETHGTKLPGVVDQFERMMRERCAHEAEDSKSECLVEGNDGRPILTMPWFNDFRRVFEILIKRSPSVCINVIPVDYGAKIDHAIRMDPEKALWSLKDSLPVVESIRNRLAEPTHVEADRYRSLFQARMLFAMEQLKRYQEVAFEVMEAISMFRRDYDPLVHEGRIFEPFLRKVQQIGHDLANDEDGFYEKFFLAQIQYKTLRLAQSGESILSSQEKTGPEKIEAQIELMQDWFATIHLWASRMEGHLRKHFKP